MNQIDQEWERWKSIWLRYKRYTRLKEHKNCVYNLWACFSHDLDIAPAAWTTRTSPKSRSSSRSRDWPSRAPTPLCTRFSSSKWVRTGMSLRSTTWKDSKAPQPAVTSQSSVQAVSQTQAMRRRFPPTRGLLDSVIQEKILSKAADKTELPLQGITRWRYLRETRLRSSEATGTSIGSAQR